MKKIVPTFDEHVNERLSKQEKNMIKDYAAGYSKYLVKKSVEYTEPDEDGYWSLNFDLQFPGKFDEVDLEDIEDELKDGDQRGPGAPFYSVYGSIRDNNLIHVRASGGYDI